MRIGGGEARGRRLKGAAVPGVRPTTERVKAAIFNILAAEQYRGRRTLDLFAGVGGLGLEALSRGAAWADFVERDRRQCAVIRENLSLAGFGGRAAVRQGDAVRSLAALPGGYSLALLDPPYRMGAFHGVMDAIARRPGLLAPDAVVVAGHSRQTELRAAYGSLRRITVRQYGDNVVDFYRNESSGETGAAADTAAGTDTAMDTDTAADMSRPAGAEW